MRLDVLLSRVHKVLGSIPSTIEYDLKKKKKAMVVPLLV